MKALKINDYSNEVLLESEVIKRVLSGEKGLYEILMRRHNQKLYRVIRGYLSDEDVIKDVMQNTYIIAYEKLYQFKEKSSFSTWLIRIGINEALKEIKENKRHIHVTTSKSQLSLSSNDINPEKAIIQEESVHILEKAIDHLPSKYKAIYILREVEKMNLNDICECLDISKGNAKVRIHRAKSLLKDILYDQSQKLNVFEFGFNKCDAIVAKVMDSI